MADQPLASASFPSSLLANWNIAFPAFFTVERPILPQGIKSLFWASGDREVPREGFAGSASRLQREAVLRSNHWMT